MVVPGVLNLYCTRLSLLFCERLAVLTPYQRIQTYVLKANVTFGIEFIETLITESLELAEYSTFSVCGTWRRNQ